MSIANEIQRLQTAKSDLKDAINAKLKDNLIENELIDEYAGFVDGIESGGEPNFFPINLQQDDTEIIIDTELEPNAFLGVMKNGNYKFYMIQEVTE